MEVEYVKLDPFNIAFYDASEKKIYLDEKVKGTEIEHKLINHEKKHEKTKFIEPISLLEFELFFKILKYKPLHIFQFMFPFVIGVKKNGEFIFKIDPFGLVVFLLFAFSISILVSYSVIYCYSYENCEICNIFSVCKNITIEEICSICEKHKEVCKLCTKVKINVENV